MFLRRSLAHISYFFLSVHLGVLPPPPPPPQYQKLATLLEFNDLLEQCLGEIGRENKPCYIVGDFNFDLLNSSLHSDTDSFISSMYSFSFFPLITKPTRVTTRSCSCIDNIFTNVVDKPILPGSEITFPKQFCYGACIKSMEVY